MFTGIIEMIGTVVGRGAGELVIAPRRSLRKLSLGESVSVDGVCLTVDRRAGQKILFRLLEETVRSSTLGALRKGDPVNLERSLRCGDRLGGHLLLGHVDGQGVLVSRSRSGRNLTLGIEVPGHIVSALVPKGPIAVDGISLTLDPRLDKRKRQVRVHLIPRTAKATTLGGKPLGARVNIELDLIVKYLRAMLY